MNILETPRLILREMTESDYPSLAAIIQDEQTMYAYNGAMNDEETQNWLDKQLARYRDDGFGLWAVIFKDNGEMIGQAGISWQHIDGESVPEIGYLFNRAYWGKGYATEAAEACKQYAFENLRFNEIYSIIRDNNIPSINVAIRIGMLARKKTVRHYRGEDMLHFVFSARKGDKIMSLSTIEAIRTRYSCRAFSGKMPSDTDLQTIAGAAVASPSAMNRQPWQIIVVKNKELLADMEVEGMKNLAALPDKSTYERIMSRGGKIYYNAPCMVIVATPKSEHVGWEVFDCGIVSENIALAAASLGIDSLICGMISFAFSGDKGNEFKHRIQFPDGHNIGIAVLLGYAANPGGKPHEPDLSKITVIE